jgi:hypothetical protein
MEPSAPNAGDSAGRSLAEQEILLLNNGSGHGHVNGLRSSPNQMPPLLLRTGADYMQRVDGAVYDIAPNVGPVGYLYVLSLYRRKRPLDRGSWPITT